MTPEQLIEAIASWRRETAVPQVEPESLTIALGSLRGLSAVRRQLRTFLFASLTDSASPEAEELVERAVLVVDELASNALRHAAGFAQLHVFDGLGRWVLVVTDGEPAEIPLPAVDRPAGGGGYGLHMITDLSADHGVHYTADHKLVWAVVLKN